MKEPRRIAKVWYRGDKDNDRLPHGEGWSISPTRAIYPSLSIPTSPTTIAKWAG